MMNGFFGSNKLRAIYLPMTIILLLSLLLSSGVTLAQDEVTPETPVEEPVAPVEEPIPEPSDDIPVAPGPEEKSLEIAVDSHPPCSESRVYGCVLTYIDYFSKKIPVYLNSIDQSGTYQCVELVKRFYRQFFNYTIGTVHDANNFYDTAPTSIWDKKAGSPSDFTPIFGDIVFDRNSVGGHVALVKKYDSATKTITIVEQNWFIKNNLTSWRNATGERKILYGSNNIDGFLRYKNNKPVSIISPKNGEQITSIKLDWSDYGCQTCGTIYRLKIYLDNNVIYDSSGNVTLNNSNLTLTTPLPTEKTYYWMVKDEYTGRYSSKESFYLMKLNIPTLITPVSITTNSLRPTFDWGSVPGAIRYQIRISGDPTWTNTGLSYFNEYVTSSRFTPETDLPRNKKLYWKVRASDGVNVTPYSAVSSFTTPNPPSVPKLIKPANGATGVTRTPKLDWYSSSLPSGTAFNHYRILVATDSTFTTLIIDKRITGIDNSSYQVPSGVLAGLKKYYWRVRAYNTLGQYSSSSIWSFTTK